MEIKYKKEDEKYVQTQTENDDYDISVFIVKEEVPNGLDITHKIKLRSREQDSYEATVKIGDWEFCNPSLFLNKMEKGNCRIDFQARCGNDKEFWNFYSIDGDFGDEFSDIASFLMTAIGQVADCSSLQEFDSRASSLIVVRIGSPIISKI